MSTMIRVLIPYGTTEGHTARIAEYLADVIRHQGYEAYPVDVKRFAPPQMGRSNAVIVGGSVHMGKHDKFVLNFVKQNRDALARLPSAFFSVSLAARDRTEEARKEVDGYIERFIQETGWSPDKVGSFAGALLYTRYGFFKRWMMRKIARDKGSRDLDTSRDYVYTDWQSVRRFAEEFLEALAAEDAPILSRVGQ